MTRDDIFAQIKAALVELFEVDEEAITPEARLYQDLELDSIDAIDLVVHLQKLTGKKIAGRVQVGAQRQRRGGCGRASAGRRLMPVRALP